MVAKAEPFCCSPAVIEHTSRLRRKPFHFRISLRGYKAAVFFVVLVARLEAAPFQNGVSDSNGILIELSAGCYGATLKATPPDQ